VCLGFGELAGVRAEGESKFRRGGSELRPGVLGNEHPQGVYDGDPAPLPWTPSTTIDRNDRSLRPVGDLDLDQPGEVGAEALTVPLGLDSESCPRTVVGDDSNQSTRTLPVTIVISGRRLRTLRPQSPLRLAHCSRCFALDDRQSVQLAQQLLTLVEQFLQQRDLLAFGVDLGRERFDGILRPIDLIVETTSPEVPLGAFLGDLPDLWCGPPPTPGAHRRPRSHRSPHLQPLVALAPLASLCRSMTT